MHEAPPYARKPVFDAALVGHYGPGDTGWRDGEFWFDEHAANKRVRFIEVGLTHVKGKWAGRPFLLEPWQKNIVRAIFGWLRPDGSRRYRKLFLYVPRKNGKTLLLAAILLCLFLIDCEAGAEIYNVAATRKQAAICFKAAKQMALRNPVLRRQIKAYKSAMEAPATASTYQALSSDQGGTQHGENPHAVGFDELHALKSEDLYEAMTTGSLARTQPLIIFTTTADVVRESVCNSEYAYARTVRDGLVDDPYYLPVIYEAPRDADGNVADWKLESTWRATNPNFGVSIDPVAFAAEIKRAIDDESKQNQVKRLYLNISTSAVTLWLAAEKWRACATTITAPGAFAAALRGQDAFGALDLADRLDLSSLVLLFPPAPALPPGASSAAAGSAPPSAPAAPTLRAFWRHWVPEETLIDTKLRAHARYYTPWARGCICRTTASALERLDCPAWIHVTPGNVTDYDYLRADIAALATRYRINEIAVDKAQATQLMGQLAQDGLTVFEHAQSCLAMHPGISELERIIIGRQFEHSGDPVAAWAFGNVATDQNSYGQKRFEKAVGTKKTGRVMRKIDPMQVLAMATGRAALRVDTFNAVKGAVIL